jgi:hypothetical protein
MQKICNYLNDNEIYTINNNKWDRATISKLLSHKVYIGKIIWNGEEFDGLHEPIVPPELFQKVQEKLLDNQKQHQKYVRNEKKDFMLKGIVRCSACGATLVRYNNAVQCGNYRRGVCKISHSITLEKLNNLVIKRLIDDYGSLNFKLSPPSKPTLTVDNSQLIQKEKQKLQRAKEAYTAGVDTLKEYKITKSKILNRIKSLENSQTSTPDNDETVSPEKFKVTVCDALKILQNPKVKEEIKSVILRSFISKIVYHKFISNIEIFYFY